MAATRRHVCAENSWQTSENDKTWSVRECLGVKVPICWHCQVSMPRTHVMQYAETECFAQACAFFWSFIAPCLVHSLLAVDIDPSVRHRMNYQPLLLLLLVA